MRLLFFCGCARKKSPLILIIPQKRGPVKQNSLDDSVCSLDLSQLEVLGSSGKLAYAAYAAAKSRESAVCVRAAAQDRNRTSVRFENLYRTSVRRTPVRFSRLSNTCSVKWVGVLVVHLFRPPRIMRITQTTRFHRLFALGLACSFIVGDFWRFEKTFHRIYTNEFFRTPVRLAGAKFT